ncbi:transmembrane transport protein [Streptomyces albus]|uniref:Transmembrane transport protein n=1 Tax=Streptomyces albus (strain ATCC 21838 / DSM 41398 / FERM P-419 / JCM 4703 / NBRC 107858) TaxID=1081613 RepID=A0A0B5FB49_STRA4|nr:transmembrane transport protein [Streptomyces albus]
MKEFLYRVGRSSFRRRRLVSLIWLGLLVVFGAGAATLSQPTVETFSIPSTESQRAIDLLGERFPQAAADGAVARVVVQAPAGEKVTDGGNREAVEEVVARLRKAPEVVDVADPFEAKALTEDKRLALIQADYGKPRGDLTEEDREALFATGEPGEKAGLTVEVGGDAAKGAPEQGAGELVGVVIAAIVLVITFGSMVAAGLPLVTAIMGVAVSLCAVQISGRFLELNSDTPALALMLGLAVSIDYALFIGFRYREELLAAQADGTEEADGRAEAAGRAVSTAGSAVVFAGLTVIIALVGLSVVNIPILTQIGVAAAFTVAVAVLIALTLLPALLGFAGNRILGRARKRATAPAPGTDTAGPTETGTTETTGTTEAAPAAGTPAAPEGAATAKPTLGMRWVRLVVRRPVLFLTAALAALVVLALPAVDLRLGLPDDGAEPKDSTQYKAYEMVSDGFGPGFNGPLTVVVDTGGKQGAAQVADKVIARVSGMEGVSGVSPALESKGKNTAVMQVTPDSAPASADTEDLVGKIRDEAGAVADGADASVAVTGTTALNIDISQRIAETLLPYLAVVVGLAFLLLMLMFRSVLVPLKAALGFLLSLAATFGVMVAVFQWGWAAEAMGVQSPGLIVNLLPVIIIGLVFGLAMDYEVFLVSRMREAYVRGAAPKDAVTEGFAHSARVVTAAVLIMISVFGGFMLSESTMMQAFGFSLAAAVFFDALVVRMTIVPALMAVLGRRAWWLPGLTTSRSRFRSGSAHAYGPEP